MLNEIIHTAANFWERNTRPEQYPGMLVLVAHDPNYPGALPDDEASNPTGKVYRLLPLNQRDLTVNEYGNDDAHWTQHSNSITGVITDPPRVIDGGRAANLGYY